MNHADKAAEQALLGAMVQSRNAIANVVEDFSPADFFDPKHETIYQVITTLYGTGQVVDPITVGAELQREGKLTAIGGLPYLHTLMQSAPITSNAKSYAVIVTDKAIQRRLAQAGARISQFAEGMGDVNELIDRARSEIFDATLRRTDETYQFLSALIPPTLDELESNESRGNTLVGLPTGLSSLDDILHGLRAGQLVVLAGRPGQGKSTLGQDILRAVCINGGKTAILFSLEMSASEVTERIIAATAEVDLSLMRAGRMTNHDWEKIAKANERLFAANLIVDDSPNTTIMGIRAKAQRIKQQHGLDLIVVDYLQLMGSHRRGESRQQEVSDISRSLKLLAKEMDIPVVAICQLNRSAEQRQDKKPQLSDMRDSGAIEQDADTVVLVFREDTYNEESSRAGEADLIVAKQRSGPTATATVVFQGRYSRFTDFGSWNGPTNVSSERVAP